MSDWNAAVEDYLGEVAGRAPPRAAATIGEIWNAEFTRSGLDTIGGVGRPFSEAYDELRGAIEQRGGADVGTLATRDGVNLAGAATADQRIAALNAIADTLPDDARKALEPLRDVRRRAADKAQSIERDANDVAGATYGLSGVATSFLAGTTRQMIDPFNLAANAVTAPLGGAFTGPALRVIARQAAAGGAAQLLVEPYVQATRAEYGIESGLTHGAIDVAQSAIGAAGLAGLFRAGGAALSYLRGPRAIAPAAGATAPSFEPTFIGYLDHEDAAAFDRGETFTPKPPAAYGEMPHDMPGFSAGNLDIAAGAEAQPTRTRLPEQPPPAPSDYTPFSFDAEAFDRGHVVRDVHPLGADAPGFVGGFDVGEGARARPTRDKGPAPQPAPSSDRGSYLTHDDIDAFDRGHAVETIEPLGGGDTPWQFNLSEGDLAAAAHLAERNHLVDGAAPPTWDPMAHAAMVDEARDAMEGGRPIDREQAAARIEQSGVAAPRPAPVEGNVFAAAAEPGPRFGARSLPTEKLSLFQYLASVGGLSPDDRGGPLGGELRGIFDNANHFVPAFGNLLRRGGKSLDQALEAASEAGYLPRGSTINDLLDLVGREKGGDAQYLPGQERIKALDPDEQRHLREQHRAALETEFDAHMAQLEITSLRKADRTRALQIMEKEGQPDPLLAYEQALTEHATREEAIRAKRQAHYAVELPGWDVPDDAGAAPAHGEDVSRQPGARSGERNAGGEPRPGGEGARDPAEQSQLGDPALAKDAERAIAAAGEDFQIIIDGENGPRQVRPADALDQAAEDARAADELFDCIGVKPEKPE